MNLDDLVTAARSDPSADWTSFGVFDANEFYALDEAAILERFILDIPRRLRVEARRSESPLANLAQQVNFLELYVHLQHLTSSISSLNPAGTSLNATDAWERARSRQRAVVASRLIRGLSRKAEIDTEQLREWRRWRDRPSWRTELISALDAVERGVRGNHEVLADHISEVTAQASKPRLSFAEAWRLLDADLLDQVGNSLSRSGGNDRQRHARADFKSLNWLESQTRQPHFHQCFTITGSFGSGTSHTLTKIAEEIGAAGDVGVFVGDSDRPSIASGVLQKLSQAFGRELYDIEDLAELMLDAPNRRVYLLVEDLEQLIHNPRHFQQFLDQISASTRVNGLQWCITANIDEYDTVLSPSNSDFWTAYSASLGDDAVSTGRALGGWLDLDDANSRASLGLNLLERVVAAEQWDVATMLAYANDFRMEHAAFANPLPAWIRFESLSHGDQGRAATDPQDPAFIAAYWAHLKRNHRPQGTTRSTSRADAELDLAVRAIADQIRASGKPSATLYPVPPGAPAVDSDAALRLRRMGLFETLPRKLPDWALITKSGFCRRSHPSGAT